MKVFIFVMLKIVELGAISLIWWIPCLVGKTRFAKYWDEESDTDWGRGTTVLFLSCLAFVVGITALTGLGFGFYCLSRTIISTNWQWATKIVEALGR